MENKTKEKELSQVIEKEVVSKVNKEDKTALKKVSSNKQIVRYLVDQYYQSQAYRITAENQARSLLQGFDDVDKEQFTFINTELDNAKVQENLNKKYMDIITDSIPVCRWMKSITGIGPVLSAYLYSVFDVTVAKYNTNFLSYAGLNDNNNPWLGKEKAKAMVKEALDYREEKMHTFNIFLKEKIGGEDEYNKLIKSIDKIGKDVIKNNDIDFDNIKKDILKLSGIDIENIKDLDISLFLDYIKFITNPKICDDILVNYIASKTTRNPNNIWKGVKNVLNSRKTKSAIAIYEDLESYLAKPPYNKDLKTKAYIIGEMFVKQSGREKSLYGKIYKDKKIEYTIKNENGEYAEEAERLLKEKNYSKETETYKRLSQGMLSDAHILARAKRYAVKLFISHVYEAMYYAEYKKEPPKTYVIQYMGHHDYIAPEVDYRPFIDNEE